jgi:WD40 repeat protein
VADDGSPFQGLGFYNEEDARWFFGRPAERKVILAHLRTARLTLLYAESGVGKSSLLRAGVAARLRELAAQSAGAGRSPRFVPIVFSAWKDDPVADLISELQRYAQPLEAVANGAAPATPDDGLAAAITRAATALDATLAIILDQFEEHFSYRLGDPHPDRLADELARCVNSPDVPANFLIAVREDAYGRLGDLFAGRIGNVYSNYLHLEYMTREAAREAIEKPVELYNSDHPDDQPIELDPDLADAVLDEVRRGNLALGPARRDRDGSATWPAANADEIETPFLQLVMTRLWEYERERGSPVLRRATLDDELGGAETIVRNHVDRALAGLDGQELEAATDVFADLVTPSGAKVAHTAGDLAKMTAHSEDLVVAVLDRLYEERIVRAVDPAPGTAQARYEIFHDRLATPILDWRDQQQNARLQRARQRAELEAQTQRAQARLFKRRARIMLGLALSLLILLVAVVVLLQYARDKSATASREQRQATFFGLNTRAQSQLSSRPDISLLLYLAAYDQSPQPVAERSLVATLHEVQRSGAIGILHGHTDAVESVAFSPVGRTLASASGDKTIRLWRVGAGGHYPLGAPLRSAGPLYSDAFAPGGQLLASGGFNDVVLWSIPRHAQQTVIHFRAGAIDSVAFSARGNMLAAAGSNGTVLLLNDATGQRRVLPVSSGKPVRSVAFSPDGTTLAASDGRGVSLWQVATARRRNETLTGPTGTIDSVAFSPRGATVAAGGGSGSIVFWNIGTGRENRPPLGKLGLVNSLAFSPDGRALAAGGKGSTVVWSLAGDRVMRKRLTGGQGDVSSVAFSADSRTLASASANRTISLWSYPLGPRFGTPVLRRNNATTEVAVSPDGSLVASAGQDGQIYLVDQRTGTPQRVLHAEAGAVGDLAFEHGANVLAAAYADGTIRIWNVTAGAQIGTPLRGHVGPVFSIAFAPDDKLLVSGGVDGTARLWSVRTHRKLGRPLRVGLGAVFAVAFNPSGTVVAAGGVSRAIRFWNARTQLPLVPPLIAQAQTVFGIAFSPNGRLLASGGADDAIHLWTIEPHRYAPLHTLTGDSSFIRDLAFSPDGRTLASASSDTTARLWDVATGTELGNPLARHKSSVERVAFTPDGRLLYTGSSDNTVRVWQAVQLPRSFADLRNEVCGFLGAGLSPAEWAHYAPSIRYQQTCPRTTPS